MTRYTLLREWVAYLAASAEDQLGHDLGADDAVNEPPHPLEDMLYCGELTEDEATLVNGAGADWVYAKMLGPDGKPILTKNMTPIPNKSALVHWQEF